MRWLTLVLACTFPAASGQAADYADQAKPIVAQYCVDCHEVPGYDTETRATIDAPAFRKIAADPETYPPDRLRTFLRQPHFPMKGMMLSPSDIDKLVAYFKSLRTE